MLSCLLGVFSSRRLSPTLLTCLSFTSLSQRCLLPPPPGAPPNHILRAPHPISLMALKNDRLLQLIYSLGYLTV